MTTASLREQLKAVKPAVRVSAKAAGTLPDSANAWVKDGLDHINIARHAASNLGKMLNMDYIRNWEHSVLGPFRSMNSLWYFLRAKNRTDAIRSLAGPELRRFVDTRCDGFGGHLPNFRIMILDSMYKRIKACGDIAATMVQSVLPFDSYRENESGIRIRFEHTPWVVGGYEEIRLALRENRAPNFTDLAGRIDGPMADIYKPILKQLVREPTEEEILELTKAKKAEEKKQRKQLHQNNQQRQEGKKNKPARVDLAAIQNIDDETLDAVVNGNVADASPKVVDFDDDEDLPIIEPALAVVSVEVAEETQADDTCNLAAIPVDETNYTLSEIQPGTVIGIDPSIGEDSAVCIDSIAMLQQETMAMVSATTAVTDAAAA